MQVGNDWSGSRLNSGGDTKLGPGGMLKPGCGRISAGLLALAGPLTEA